jgi:hypothetical protein
LKVSTFDDTPVVLRRRAKQLEREEGYNPQFVSVFLRAADELVVRRRCASADEQEAIEQLGHVGVLKRVLTAIAAIVARSSMSKDDRRAVGQNLNIAAQVRDPHKPRTILSIEIVPNEPFEAFLDRVKELYDQHTGGATHGPESEEEEGDETPQPRSAGSDADQHPRAEAPRVDDGGIAQERLRSDRAAGEDSDRAAENGEAAHHAPAAGGDDGDRRAAAEVPARD